MHQALQLLMLDASIPLAADCSLNQLLTSNNQTWNPWTLYQDLFWTADCSKHTAAESQPVWWHLGQTGSFCGVIQYPLASLLTRLGWDLGLEAHKKLFVSIHLVAQEVFSYEQLILHQQQWIPAYFGAQKLHPLGQGGISLLLPRASVSCQACRLLCQAC